MTRASALLGTALGLALFACVSTPDEPAAPDPIGCWYFEQNAATLEIGLPWGVRLSEDTLEGWHALAARGGNARRAATLVPAAADADHPFGYWLVLSRDSLEIGYPAGGGILVRVAFTDTSMTGEARPLGDAIRLGAGPRSAHPVRLMRAQCPTT